MIGWLSSIETPAKPGCLERRLVEHVGRLHLLRILVHHDEEGLEVEGHSSQGVGSGSSGDEFQVAIERG